MVLVQISSWQHFWNRVCISTNSLVFLSFLYVSWITDPNLVVSWIPPSNMLWIISSWKSNQPIQIENLFLTYSPGTQAPKIYFLPWKLYLFSYFDVEVQRHYTFKMVDFKLIATENRIGDLWKIYWPICTEHFIWTELDRIKASLFHKKMYGFINSLVVKENYLCTSSSNIFVKVGV